MIQERERLLLGDQGLPNNLIELAGGENIYKDLGQDYATVSFEDIVQKILKS